MSSDTVWPCPSGDGRKIDRVSERRFKMKKWCIALLCIVVAVGGLAAQTKPFVAMVTDANGLGDGSFKIGRAHV
jgi:basic membrane lipoprotein Med (substrate-binding protein (PBP1-ABC) superfamily)